MNMTEEEYRNALIERQGKEYVNQLANAKVVIAGLGGLGSNLAIFLARAGVGHLHLVDFDLVDLSNIHRQQYRISQIGKPKTQAMCEILKEINPFISVMTTCAKITEENIDEIIGETPYILEAFDQAESKALLVNYVLEQRPDSYIVAASGMAGIESGNSITTRKITDHFYLAGDGVSDVLTEGSLFAPRVAICAGHQAVTMIRIIIGKEEG